MQGRHSAPAGSSAGRQPVRPGAPQRMQAARRSARAAFCPLCTGGFDRGCWAAGAPGRSRWPRSRRRPLGRARRRPAQSRPRSWTAGPGRAASPSGARPGWRPAQRLRSWQCERTRTAQTGKLTHVRWTDRQPTSTEQRTRRQLPYLLKKKGKHASHARHGPAVCVRTAAAIGRRCTAQQRPHRRPDD